MSAASKPRSKMLPPLFANNYLDSATVPSTHGGRVSPSRMRPRTTTPGGLKIPSGGGEGHLEDALELALSIATRMKREGHVTTDRERQLSSQIGRLLGQSGVFSGAAPSHHPSLSIDQDSLDHTQNEVRNNSFAETPTNNGRLQSPSSQSRQGSARTISLFGKLKQASAAAFVYKEMADSKEDLSRITQFNMHCSTAALDASTLSRVIAEQVHQISAATAVSATHVYHIDPNGMLYDPVTQKAVAVDNSTPEGKSCKKESAFIHKDNLYVPLHAQNEKVEVFVGLIVVDGGGKMDSVAVQKLQGIVPICTLSLRNLMLHSSVRWQVDKAEAMLMMANQLSRDNLDERILVQSIMQTAKSLTESDRCSIFLVNGANLQAYFEDGKSVTMSIDSGIAGHVAKSGETVNIREAYEDARFNSAVDKATGYRTKTILCMPVHYEGSIVAVAQLINKKPKAGKAGDIERVFSKRDEELFMTFSTFAGVSLRNCRINANLLVEKKKSEAVLDVVQMLSDTDIRDVNQIVSHVMLGAKKLLNADRSSLFLIDKERDELYSKVADSTGGKEIRFKSGKGIAGTVASSGIAENIHDAYEDERFNRDVDKAFNYRTRSILCEPITCKGDVLAVAQLVNRIDENTGEVIEFTSRDQETFREFSMFAGISISNSHLLEFAVRAGQEAMALQGRMEQGPGTPGLSRSRSGNLSRHNSEYAGDIGDDEFKKADDTEIEETEDVVARPDFDLFKVRETAGEAAKDAAVKVVMKTIMSTGLPQKFKCPEKVLLTFILQCRKRYRNVPYHNFFHAVDACQTIRTFIFDGKLDQFLTDLECFVLLITALVHDLDHMGLNNSFHLKTDSPLGILSSASGNNSVLEVHHCNLAIEILEDPKSNVFIGLEPAEAKLAYRGMIDCVLATDMARHNELLEDFKQATPTLTKDNDEHRTFAMKMVMKAADISNVTKPFPVSKKWAMAVTEEFYQQGDKEKEKGVDVLPMFDRDANNELAKGQIGFINFICIKYFAAIADAFGGLQWTIDNVQRNLELWKSEVASS